MTCLHYAVSKGELDTVKLLISNDADINAKTNKGSAPLDFAADRGQLDIVRLIIDKGANIDCLGSYGLTRLQFAVKNKKLEVAKLVIENGADIDATDDCAHYALHKGGTLLHWAARWWAHGTDLHRDILKFLVENGANINATENNGRTPLCLIIKHYG